MIKTRTLTLILCVVLLAACSNPGWRRHKSINHDQAIKTARDMIGVPYLWGGESPTAGFDCSGLVVYSYQKAGIKLPRTAFLQFKATRPVRSDLIQPGDLLFFRLERDKISHVAIYLGRNRFIHAPSTGKLVSVAELTTPFWKKRFVRAGRITPNPKFRYRQ